MPKIWIMDQDFLKKFVRDCDLTTKHVVEGVVNRGPYVCFSVFQNLFYLLLSSISPHMHIQPFVPLLVDIQCTKRQIPKQLSSPNAPYRSCYCTNMASCLLTSVCLAAVYNPTVLNCKTEACCWFRNVCEPLIPPGPSAADAERQSELKQECCYTS